MTLTPGFRLGRYEIRRSLGAGGMGEVYLARDDRLRRDVALKVLTGDFVASPEYLARFEHEARAVASVNHPNIVVLYSIEEHEDTRFITMELVEGTTLGERIRPGGLPVPDLLSVAIPLAEALAAAHDKGIVHRDLKPANVMVTPEGRVKVLDFGLAKLMTPEDPHARTVTAISNAGVVMGSVPYMAPEQIRGGSIDARSDLFSFGIILYELATGVRPFPGSSFADVYSSILRDVPGPLARARSDLPAGLIAIIDRCLEKRADDRFGSAREALNAMRAVERAGPDALATPAPANTVASIAVLPFVNRSASREDEYFSDGLADELLNVLAKIRGLRVAARTSAFTFKGKDATVAEIGRALNVATVLEGSVRTSGARVRIAVQLVKVSDGYPLWSETFDRMLDDVFAVQEDIARAVVRELRATLLGDSSTPADSGELRDEVSRALHDRRSDPEAAPPLFQARHFMERSTREDTYARGPVPEASHRA
jgi:TolB-like protein